MAGGQTDLHNPRHVSQHMCKLFEPPEDGTCHHLLNSDFQPAFRDRRSDIEILSHYSSTAPYMLCDHDWQRDVVHWCTVNRQMGVVGWGGSERCGLGSNTTVARRCGNSNAAQQPGAMYYQPVVCSGSVCARPRVEGKVQVIQTTARPPRKPSRTSPVHSTQ